MKKRIISMLLVLMMVMTLMPMAALADDPGAEVNGEYYADLPTAVAAAPAGATVKVLQDIVIDEPEDAHANGHYFYVTIDKELTLDLNGKTIKFSDAIKEKTCNKCHVVFGLVGEANVTITGNGTIDSFDGAAGDGGIGVWLRNAPNAKLTIENGTFYGAVQILYISNGGNIVINGGRFENNTGIGDGVKQLFNVNGYNAFAPGMSITMYGGTLVTCDPRILNDGNAVAEGYLVSKTSVYSEAFKGNVNAYTVIPNDCRVVASIETATQDYAYNHPASMPMTMTNYYTSLEAAQAAAKEGDVVETVSNPHTPVTDAALAPTCSATGLTEGSHCSVCSAVIVAQEVVPATGEHNYAAGDTVGPTCTADGYTVYTCEDCGDVVHKDIVEATGHEFVGRYCIHCFYKMPLWQYIQICIENFFDSIFH